MPVEVKPYTELPSNAQVGVWVEPGTQKRWLRWLSGTSDDFQHPTVVYYAPHWVWSLYQQGREEGYNRAKEPERRTKELEEAYGR